MQTFKLTDVNGVEHDCTIDTVAPGNIKLKLPEGVTLSQEQAYSLSRRLRREVEEAQSFKAVYVIPAEVHDDEYKYEVDFDAVEWFKQASDEDIIALADCDWGGDYPADQVAEWFEDINPKVGDLFDHKGDCGFECHVNGTKALAWLKEHRPKVYEQLDDEAEEDLE